MIREFNDFKKYSELYAKMIRGNFPSCFEKEELNNILYNIVSNDEKTIFTEKLIKNNKMGEFKSFIYSKIGKEKEKETSKNVIELLNNVGYDFYICKEKKDVLKFKKYYKKEEFICTFNNIENRLDNYYIFWIIKKNIDDIKHFGADKNRQDLYGTSCCSIQINKNNNSDISIKNRYNHSVANCDSTFSNNLDNISEGLTSAINNEFNLKTKTITSFELDNFIYKNDKFIYYNYEINNIYYGINKIYKNGELIIYDSNKFILIDYYLFDLEKSEIIKIDNNLKDDFFNFKFKKIIVKKEKNNSFEIEKDEKDVLIIYK